MGIAPVVTDGDVTLAESGAIIEYVIARHGGGRLAPAPADAAFSRLSLLVPLRQRQR